MLKKLWSTIILGDQLITSGFTYITQYKRNELNPTSQIINLMKIQNKHVIITIVMDKKKHSSTISIGNKVRRNNSHKMQTVECILNWLICKLNKMR